MFSFFLWWSERLHFHMYFPQNNHFLLNATSIFSISFTGSKFNSGKTIIHLIAASNNSQNMFIIYLIEQKQDVKTGTHIFTKIKNTDGWKKKKNVFFSYFI